MSIPKRTPIAWAKIYGARVISTITGRIPSPGTWPLVWGGTKRFAQDRWIARDAGFEKRGFDYDDALAFAAATGRGTPRDMRDGSIPKADLDFIASHFLGLKTDKPLRGLHIGNFIGISLAHLTDAARKADPDAVMLSIDPNIPHRGIDAPHDLVTGLMTRYGLEANWLPVSGFTLNRASVTDILNDKNASTAFASYYGLAATEALNTLERLGSRFDFALIDGNHNASYLSREIAVLVRLIRPGGFLFLDDVDENWEGVTKVFQGLDKKKFRRIAHKNRIGIVQRLKLPPGQGAGKAGPGKPGGKGAAAGKPGGPGKGGGNRRAVPGKGARRGEGGGPRRGAAD